MYYGWDRVTTNFGEVDVVPLQGAIAGCHCSVLWLGGKVTTNFGGVDVVPLQGAIVVCYGWGRRVTANFEGVDVVPLPGAIVWLGGRVTNFGEWTWCHCWCHRTVPLCTMVAGRVTTNFGSGHGAIAGCHCSWVLV